MCVQVVGGGWIDGWLVGRVDAVRVFMYVCMCAHTAFSACPCGQEFAGERSYVRMYVCMDAGLQKGYRRPERLECDEYCVHTYVSRSEES